MSDINDILENSSNPFDSLKNVFVDTSTLEGKRVEIMKLYYLENRFSIPSDTLLDLNYDGLKDYVIRYYAQSGTGIKNRVYVYIYNNKFNTYNLDTLLTYLPNPTFYIENKKITGFYIGHGSGSGVKLEWIKNQWTPTKKFEVEFEKDSSKWKITYPIIKRTIIQIRPYEMIPPNDILESNIK